MLGWTLRKPVAALMTMLVPQECLKYIQANKHRNVGDLIGTNRTRIACQHPALFLAGTNRYEVSQALTPSGLNLASNYSFGLNTKSTSGELSVSCNPDAARD